MEEKLNGSTLPDELLDEAVGGVTLTNMVYNKEEDDSWLDGLVAHGNNAILDGLVFNRDMIGMTPDGLGGNKSKKKKRNSNYTQV